MHLVGRRPGLDYDKIPPRRNLILLFYKSSLVPNLRSIQSVRITSIHNLASSA